MGRPVKLSKSYEKEQDELKQSADGFHGHRESQAVNVWSFLKIARKYIDNTAKGNRMLLKCHVAVLSLQELLYQVPPPAGLFLWFPLYFLPGNGIMRKNGVPFEAGQPEGEEYGVRPAGPRPLH